MKNREEKSGNVGCLILGVIGLMLPGLYVLSFGPMAFVITRNPRLDWLEVIYYPLEWLCECWTPLKDALQWYVDLWI